MKSFLIGKNGAWSLVLLVLLILFGVLFATIVREENSVEALRVRDAERAQVYTKTVGVLVALAKDAKSKEDWESVRKRTQTIPLTYEATKVYFARLADVRIIELLSGKRDLLLVNAGELLSVNENDPEAKRRLAEAKLLHDEVEKLLKQVVSDPKFPEWNMTLEYRKAFESYRSLAFIDKNEHSKALDIIAGAVANLAKALASAPKDNRTERAIEFLYQRAKEEEGKAGGTPIPGPGRPRALPNRENNDPGTGGDDRPRRH